ncbi:hypothetical protein Oter_1187 [Opitutus terrae PB90-1]|uniref:DISARM protein DrmE C-terminal domain-containing protein n=2 Tax=Opitutus terrae TaxID=107709 RepID=B1ZPF4_OPITP|nr:hypothetical protein Oter_1187 [Opitutus terrae PB90-1]
MRFSIAFADAHRYFQNSSLTPGQLQSQPNPPARSSFDIMWLNAFKSLRDKTDSLEGRLLAGHIPFRGSATGAANDALASADAVLALLARKATPPTELALVHPEATPTKARQTLLAVAFAELEHNLRHPYQSGPAGLLFVTQQIVDARAHFAAVRVSNSDIASVFNIISLPASPGRHWKNLLVANPGRALQGGPTLRGLRAMVIDASHPRTLQHLPALLAHHDLQQIPLRIIIAPPHEALLDGERARMTWLWDIPAMEGVHRLLKPNAFPLPAWGPRSYWLTADAALDEKFGEAERLLSEATRLGGSVTPPEIVEAWAALSAARALTVPLEQAERSWRNSRLGLRLKDRIEALRRASPTANGDLRHYLALHWVSLVDALAAAYERLANAGAPPKFFRLIDALDEFTERRDVPIRIVTPTESEAPLLASRLAELDADLAVAIDEGTITVMPQREEAKRVAEGNSRITLLTSARSSRYRYLDLFNSQEIHVIAYPTEGVRDRQRLERSYNRWQPMANGHRSKVALQLKLTVGSSAGPAWKAPTVTIHTSTAIPPLTRAMELPDTSLDADWTAVDDAPPEAPIRVSATTAPPAPRGAVILDLVDGGRIAFPGRSLVDIYRPETEKLVRVPVRQVAAGDFLVTLLDDDCDSLFERLCEVADRRRPALNTAHLERWKVAKSRVYQRFAGLPGLIFNKLEGKISVGQQALSAWFGNERDDEGECLAPREEADFKQVATLSEVYRDDQDMHATFRSIHEERVNRRKLGRQLRAALKSLSRGQRFEQALRTAEALDSEVEEVMHALESREIAKVSTQL